MRRRLKLALATALAAAAGPPPAWSLAMRSGASRTAVNGLHPGVGCRLADCAGGPLRLLNTGRDPTAVKLSVEKPDPGGLQDGYEPAPSASWVRLARGELALAPGQEAAMDGVVTVPGGRVAPGLYQLDWLADGRDAGGLRLRLRSRLLLDVRDQAEEDGDEDWERRRRAARREDDVRLMPVKARVAAVRVPLGRPVPLSSVGAAVKLANVGQRRQTARVRVVSGDGPGTAGYEPSPNPRFLRTSRRLDMAAGQVAEAPLWLEVPDEPRYRGRRWAFEVDIEALESAKEEPERVLVLVETEGSTGR